MENSSNKFHVDSYQKDDDDNEEIDWQSLQSYKDCNDMNGFIDNYQDIHDDEIQSVIPSSTERCKTEGERIELGFSEQWLRIQFQQTASLAMQGTEEFIRKVWRRGWGLVQHQHLPTWLKDNNFLVTSHRPELNSYAKCFRSIFRVHTETVNIWTHLLGWLAFVAIAVVVMAQPINDLQWQDKAIVMCFFIGAILCLGFSWLFHTVYCHSQKVGKIFNKLDYCGIAFLTVGSYMPWLYYSFYCRFTPKVVYVSLILGLGALAIIVSMFDKFATPQYRPLRAGVFIALGLCGVVPCLHYIIVEGFWSAIHQSSLGWLSLMALLYITGAVVYAVRIPERIFPGKFDIIFQSHQIFHVFVVIAALVHYYGIILMIGYRLSDGDCTGPVKVV